MIERASPNHEPRRGGARPDMIVLHYTDMASARDALARLCDPLAKVSAHYLIDEDGTLYRLVAEDRRAFHAGVSYWGGERDINSRSIGIELQNPGHTLGYRAFPPAQIDALIGLIGDVRARNAVPDAHILGHSDVAPDRKRDPGELFPWARLARAGIGLWPEPAPAAPDALAGLLSEVGYDPAAERRVAAFQRRFRPDRVDNRPDGETAALAAGYLRALAREATSS